MIFSMYDCLSELKLRILKNWKSKDNTEFFSRPSPKAGRELQTALDIRDDGGREGPLAKNDRSPGLESTQRLCTCFSFFLNQCFLSLYE